MHQEQIADLGITLNEHVPEVERYIRTIKERVRARASSLPFKKYLLRFIAKMVYNIVFWLKTFPHKGDVPAKISPRALIMGLAIDFHKQCKLAFGTYVQVHDEGNSTFRPRTSGAIAFQPTDNEQGRHYLLCLNSGKKLNKYTWTELPMPN